MLFFGRSISRFYIARVRIFVLRLVNGRRQLLLLLLSTTDCDEHLVLEAVEPVVIGFIVFTLA